MPQVKHVDLTGIEAIAGIVVNMSGHVEPGEYHLQITSLTEESIRDKPGDVQWVLRLAVIEDPVYQGTPIVDRFSVPSPSNPATTGMGRFKHFLQEMGLPLDRAEFELDFEKFAGRKIDALLIDDPMPASADGKYPAKTISRVERYLRRVAVKPAPKPAPAAVATVLPDADADADRIEETAAPAPAPAKAAGATQGTNGVSKPAAKAKTASAPAPVENTAATETSLPDDTDEEGAIETTSELVGVAEGLDNLFPD